ARRDQDHDGADEGREIRIDVLDADLGKDCRERREHGGAERPELPGRERVHLAPPRPMPPSTFVSTRLSKPAISGRPCALAACTAGKCSEARQASWSVQTSVTQSASASPGSSATT